MSPKVQKQDGMGCSHQDSRDNISTLVETEVGMWERIVYVNLPFSGVPKEAGVVRTLWEVTAIV